MKFNSKILDLKRFRLKEKERQSAQLAKMIIEFEDMVQMLSQKIIKEEEKTGIDNCTHFAYSALAQAARQRRENLLASLVEIKAQKERLDKEIIKHQQETNFFARNTPSRKKIL